MERTSRIRGAEMLRQEAPVPEPEDGNPRWAFIDLLLWTVFFLIVIAGLIDLAGHWILRIW